MKVRLQNQAQNYVDQKNMHEEAIAKGSPNRGVINTALQDARKQRQGAMDGLELVMQNREVCSFTCSCRPDSYLSALPSRRCCIALIAT